MSIFLLAPLLMSCDLGANSGVSSNPLSGNQFNNPMGNSQFGNQYNSGTINNFMGQLTAEEQNTVNQIHSMGFEPKYVARFLENKQDMAFLIEFIKRGGQANQFNMFFYRRGNIMTFKNFIMSNSPIQSFNAYIPEESVQGQLEREGINALSSLITKSNQALQDKYFSKSSSSSDRKKSTNDSSSLADKVQQQQNNSYYDSGFLSQDQLDDLKDFYTSSDYEEGDIPSIW